jgi:hypothetical protein
MAEKEEFQPEISDEAVKGKTGRDWADWFEVLDAAGAQQMSHKEIVAHLREHHPVELWWEQTITVTYEQARGLRQKHQTTEGYQVSASKTLPIPASLVYQAWADEQQRRQWLTEADLDVSTATQDKSLRGRWAGGPTRLDVQFYAKGENKSQISLQHRRIASAEEADQLKGYWKEALERLRRWLDEQSRS